MRNNNATQQLPLNNLIGILEDAEFVYLNAADKIDGEILPLLFRNFGDQKYRYSHQLKKALKDSAWTSSSTDKAGDDVKQIWQDVKTSYSAGRKQSIMQAFIKGEEGTIENYQMIIEQMKNDHELKPLLLQQVNGIRTVLNTIKAYSSFGKG